MRNSLPCETVMCLRVSCQTNTSQSSYRRRLNVNRISNLNKILLICRRRVTGQGDSVSVAGGWRVLASRNMRKIISKAPFLTFGWQNSSPDGVTDMASERRFGSHFC